jgi:CheY-like chemotaxis protein
MMLAILDIDLPSMSGFQATQKLAAWAETGDIPVIAMSAAAMMREAARAAGPVSPLPDHTAEARRARSGAGESLTPAEDHDDLS